jgi:nitroimidazol reductase NimA-like FMN-containing flavoprotein (pyridoxamine 5'-phosphate oxidase superfamily)
MDDRFEVTQLNQVRRVAKRGAYEHEAVYAVIDDAMIGHVAILNTPDPGVIVIPMIHARVDNGLVFHGARASRLMTALASGQPLSISFAIVDGLVLAKSLFHHSMNYRSAVVFGRGTLLNEMSERLAALQALSDKIMPGRWEDARLPSDKEMGATAVVRVEIESASAKTRTGGPIDDREDQELPVWSGVIPVESRFFRPQADDNSASIPLPGYLERFANYPPGSAEEWGIASS